MNKETCPICEGGTLKPLTGSNSVTYKGVTRFLPLEYSVCSFCGTEQGDAKQTSRNAEVMKLFKAEVEGDQFIADALQRSYN